MHRCPAGAREHTAQEDFIKLFFAIVQGGLGPFAYRMAPLESL